MHMFESVATTNFFVGLRSQWTLESRSRKRRSPRSINIWQFDYRKTGA